MAARLAMRRYDCRNRTPCFLASRVSPLIAACKSFASVGKVMFLGCTVVSTEFQLVAEARAPMAQVRALVRKLVLEELLSSEVLEIRVIDPALARTFVGQAVN